MIIAGAAAWTVASCVRAQAPVRLAFVEAGTATANHHFLDAFVRGMHAQGYELGRDVVVDALWADGAVERFPALLAKAIAYDPRVIVVASTPGALAAKAATARIPIVFVGVSDPFQRGLVESLARPAGNVTGLSAGDIGTIAKLVGYLRELLPKARRMAVVWNPNGIEARMRGALEAIHSLNLEGAVLQVRRSEDFTDAFAAMQAQAFDAFATASRSSAWRPSTAFPAGTNSRSSPAPAVCSRIPRMFHSCSSGRRSTSTRFCAAHRRVTCPSNSQRRTNSRSTCMRRGSSGWSCQQSSCLAPTKSFGSGLPSRSDEQA
jgi:hypothetical protein